jgi:hypothetical protein
MRDNTLDEYKFDIQDRKFIVKDSTTGYRIDLRKRLLSLALKSIKFLMTIPQKRKYNVLNV